MNKYMNQTTPVPNRATLPILKRLITIYKSWHETMPNLAKASRYTLGEKIDTLFLEVTELVYTASFLPKEEKLPSLQKAIAKTDLLKFFFQIGWEIKSFDAKKYIMFSEQLDEIGRQLGGWARQTAPKEPPAPGKRGRG
jgi:hypothetical protein